MRRRGPGASLVRMNAPASTSEARASVYDRLGHDAVVALAERFYDRMDATEPELVAVHKMDVPGRVAQETRDNFALFLVQWLGGPGTYSQVHGHPRLRGRHAHIAIGTELRDAWMRAMDDALDHPTIPADLRSLLSARFGDVADFLRNKVGR